MNSERRVEGPTAGDKGNFASKCHEMGWAVLKGKTWYARGMNLNLV